MIACVSLPFFAAAVERRQDSALARVPLAIGGQPWEARPIYAFSQEAAHKGVRAGMSLRLVHVLLPSSHFMPADEPHYSEAAGEVVDVLVDFSSLVEVEELWHPSTDVRQQFTVNSRLLPARYCLDLDGLALPESVAFVKEMGQRLRRETYFAPAIGLASNKFTAQVAATVCRPNHALPVRPGDTAGFLAGRSLHFLPLEKEALRRLRLMGIRTLGQLAVLPLAAVRAQFGPDVEKFHRLAGGEAGDRLAPAAAERREALQRHFLDHLSNRYDLAAVLEQMAAELAHRLQAAGLAARGLCLELDSEDDGMQAQTLALRQPVAGAVHLATALNELADLACLQSPLTSLTITATGLVPRTTQQLTLFAETTGAGPVYGAIVNVAARYPGSHFYQPVSAERDHPLPEQRFQLQPLAYDPALA